MKLKLIALMGGAFRHGGFLYDVGPLDPALKGGDCGVLSVRQNILAGGDTRGSGGGFFVDLEK